MFGLKCLTCINRRLANKDLSNDRPVLQAEQNANLAVVVVDGKSLCATHYHEHLMGQTMQEISKALGEIKK